MAASQKHTLADKIKDMSQEATATVLKSYFSFLSDPRSGPIVLTSMTLQVSLSGVEFSFVGRV